MKDIVRLWLIALLFMSVWLPAAQEGDPYKSKPADHEKNKGLAATAYEANLKKHANNTNILVLPGLVADRQRRRVELTVESAGLAEAASCEFAVVSEASQHAYEALLISFAQAGSVHQALKFIGQDPGEPVDPGSLRFWPRGECFRVSLVQGKEPPIQLERLLLDRRTGNTLPEEGFRFVGSVMLPVPNDPGKKAYGADAYQPMAIVSLFNSTCTVLEVPRTASKGEAYQNTIINPEHRLTGGGLLTLVIEPLNDHNTKRVKDLFLQVDAAATPLARPLTGLERVNQLVFQLKDAATLLNEKPSLSSVVAVFSALDRKKHDYFLTVSFGDGVELGGAQALAKILAIMDSERGMRIEPPPVGQLYYRAFTPDRDLLDRDARMFHPWELSLSEKAGAVSGKLLRIDSVYRTGVTRSELEIVELPVSSPQDLRRELDAEVERTRKANKRAKPPVMMVFVPSTLTYGQLRKFLELSLPTHKTIHVYLDEPMPPIPGTKP